MSVRVFLVDDHALFRTGVRAELMSRHDANLMSPHDIVGEAADVETAVARIPAARPDVVLLDVHLPGGGGVEVLRRLLATEPDVRFLALSVSDAPEDVIAIIRAGARGYVTKSITGDELADAVAASPPGTRCSRPAWPASSSMPSPTATRRPRPSPTSIVLTPRERDVLRLIARGYTYKEIARELVLV